MPLALPCPWPIPSIPPQATSRPRASEEDIDFILSTISDFLDVKVSRGDVLSTWCGIRPLPQPRGPKTGNTENVVRDHGACARVCLCVCVGGCVRT